MLCKWCNSEVDDNAKFCTNCGGKVDSISNQNINQQQVQGNTINSNSQNLNSQESKANIWLVILSFIVPLAGLIIFLVKKDDDKKTAKASGIAALVSVGISFIFSIIMVVVVSLSVGTVVNNVEEGVNDMIEDNQTVIPDINTNNGINDTGNVNVSSDWKNYEFVVNNKTLKLPCTYSELSSATLFEMKSADMKSYLQTNYYALINLYKDDKLALYIEVLNDTGADILYTDAKITRVSQTKYQTSQGAESIIFPGGLKVGQEITKDELVVLFGEPSDVYNYASDGYSQDKYTYLSSDLYTTTNYYQISVVNGVIDELSLDNRNYN